MSDETTTAELRHVDPGTLVMLDNVRSNAKTDAKMVGSIKQHGVLQPITARECDDGLVVLYGHRRTLAAIEAGCPTVPVLVIPATDDPAGRIITQMGENDHRDGITDLDRANAYAQLALIGLSAHQIARKTGRPVAEVKAGTTVASSGAAQKAITDAEVTLEEAAILAEFEDDPEAIAQLIDRRRWNGIEHAAQRLRDERAEKATRDAAAEALSAQGVRVIEEPGYSDTKTRKLDDLTDSNGEPLTVEGHAACPGHVAWLSSRYGYSYGTDQPHSPIYGCDQAKANGHKPARPSVQLTGGPMSDEEKAERRTVIANNKAWDSATAVRGRWIEQFHTGTKAPKGVEAFILRALLLEGIERASYNERNTPTGAEEAPQAALRAVAARILTQWHSNTSRQTWRAPRAIDQLCMSQAIAWGYTASDVEQLLTN